MGLALSAIMPTTARRLHSLPLAIACLKQQTCRDVELIVISEDDSALARAEVLTRDAAISTQLIACDRSKSVGAKRNLGCAAARTPWITFWDDDDWCRADRIALTLERTRDDVEIVGSPTMLVRELHGRRRTFIYHYLRPGGTYPERYLVGGTLTFTKRLWELEPFGDQVGEDAWWQMRPRIQTASARQLPADPTLYVAMIHDQNTANKQVPQGDPCWSLWQGDLAGLLGDALAQFEACSAR